MERNRNDEGFTLVELMLVVVILGILAAVAVPRIMGSLGEAKKGKAKSDVAVLELAIEQFSIHTGRFPTATEGLDVLVNDSGIEGWTGPYLKRKQIPLDPWKNDYHYVEPAEQSVDYDVYSMGPDEAENTADDIGNWETVAKRD